MKFKPRSYRDQQAWKDLQALLPERLRLTDASAPQEEFWNYAGHESTWTAASIRTRGRR